MYPGKEVFLFNIFPNFVKTISKHINRLKLKLEKDTKCALLLKEFKTPIQQGNYLTFTFFIKINVFSFFFDL